MTFLRYDDLDPEVVQLLSSLIDGEVKKDEDGFFAIDGAVSQDIEGILQINLFDFCACGRPNDNLTFIRDGLEHIDSARPDGVEFREWYDDWVEEGLELFGSEESRQFFFYWTDSEELTEHGGSIPGWLTGRGKDALELLNHIYA